MSETKHTFLLGDNLFIDQGSIGTMIFDVVDLYNNISTGKYAFSEKDTIRQEIRLAGETQESKLTQLIALLDTEPLEDYDSTVLDMIVDEHDDVGLKIKELIDSLRPCN